MTIIALSQYTTTIDWTNPSTEQLRDIDSDPNLTGSSIVKLILKARAIIK